LSQDKDIELLYQLGREKWYNPSLKLVLELRLITADLYGRITGFYSTANCSQNPQPPLFEFSTTRSPFQYRVNSMAVGDMNGAGSILTESPLAGMILEEVNLRCWSKV